MAPQDQKAQTPEALKALVVETVSATTGIKGVELVAEIAGLCHARGIAIPVDGFHECLAALVREGRIVELEYLVPEMPGRVKSVYFPAGTEMRLHAA